MIPRPHALMDHRYNSLHFSIQNSNSYSFVSQTFMLQGSHMGPTPVMPWGGSLAVRQPPTWPSSPSGRYWPPPPPVDHSGQSSSTPPPPSGQGYWPLPPWAPLARGQALPWGMPPWTTLMLQPQWPSSPPMVSHLCLLSIVPFVAWENVECLAYSFIYIFKRPSSSAGLDFIDRVLNLGGSGEGEGGGTSNDAAPWLSCMSCCVLVWILCRFLCEDYVLLCEDYGFSLIYALLCQTYMYYYINLLYDLFWRLPIWGGRQNMDYIKNQYIPQLTEERMTYIPRLTEEYMDTWSGGS
jgi:hypothetical protein